MSRSHPSILALAAAVLGCGDSSAPTPLPREEVSVAFCADQTWFAYQNEGDVWTRGVPAGGVVTFEATEKVTIAVATVRGFLSNVTILQLTSDQLDALACEFSGAAGTKALSGTVAGLSSEAFADIALGDASSVAFANGAYPMSGVAAGPLDLVAARRFSLEFPHVVDRFVIHRDVDVPHNGALPLVDFEAADAFASVQMLVVIEGGPDDQRIENTFVTSRGTSHHLFDEILLDRSLPLSVPVYSVPVARQVAGDLHELHVQAYSSTDLRDVYLLYAAPGNKTMTLGPPVPAPVVTSVATSPIRRLRFESASSALYADVVAAFVLQSQVSWSLLATKEFFGSTPATWILTMPDLAAVDGFQASWALQSGGYDLLLEQAQGRLAAILGRPAIDGDVLRFGSYETSTSNDVAGLSSLRACARREHWRSNSGNGEQSKC
jgi:hypothetical protein